MPYGKEFLEVRKAANKYLHQSPVKEYQPLQIKAVHNCIRNLLETPDIYLEHLRELVLQYLRDQPVRTSADNTGVGWLVTRY